MPSLRRGRGHTRPESCPQTAVDLKLGEKGPELRPFSQKEGGSGGPASASPEKVRVMGWTLGRTFCKVTSCDIPSQVSLQEIPVHETKEVKSSNSKLQPSDECDFTTLKCSGKLFFSF